MTDNLNLPQVAAAQNQKEVTINAATQQLSSAIGDYLSANLASGDYTLSTANFQQYMGFVTTGNAVSRNFNLPAVKRAFFYVENGGSAVLSIVEGSTTITLGVGAVAFFQTDGTANGLVQIAPTVTGTEVDVGLIYSSLPLTGQIANYPINQAMKLVTGLTGSNFFVGTNPTATAVFNLYKVVSGTPTSIGNLSVSTGGAVTVTFTGDVSFAVGNVFRVVAPNPQDATLADVGLNFKFTKL